MAHLWHFGRLNTVNALERSLNRPILKVRLLPTTIDSNGSATAQQHSSCLIIDDCVAIDAGNLAAAVNDTERAKIRNVVLTHAHLDHIAGLPIFIDDLFATLTEPVTVHATKSVIEALENHIFNWIIYPRFSELKNDFGDILKYAEIKSEKDFAAAHLVIKPIEVNHKVPSVGFIVSDGAKKIAISGDTAAMDRFWEIVNEGCKPEAIFMECAFPDELENLADSSHHLTPRKIRTELAKCRHQDGKIYLFNLKPMYREKIIREVGELKIENLNILEVNKTYEF